jgi:hypothetical protein
MRAFALLPLLALAACGEGEVARPTRMPAPPIPVPSGVSGPSTAAPPASIDSIRGQGARTLIARFGTPRIDVQEGPARKLQFAGPACILDIYLYPQGGREPAATHFDARLRDGRPADPAACVATLRKTGQ